jgi:hemerythrin
MSDFVEWSDDLSVGIEEIDDQHKELVDLVNEMHEAIHQRRGRDVVRRVLAKLADYTRIHFAVEESLMRILGYPDYETHKEQHEQLIRHMTALQNKVDSGKTAIGFELMHFLKVWLTKHIMESDREYGEFFIQAGVKPRLRKRSWTALMWNHVRG